MGISFLKEALFNRMVGAIAGLQVHTGSGFGGWQVFGPYTLTSGRTPEDPNVLSGASRTSWG